MSPPTTVASATRRLFWLTALRWLPVGLLTPVLVLLAQARGLSLPEIGLVLVVHSAVVVVLELPTGGLADTLGRRPVLLLSAVLHLLSCLVLLVAGGFAAFALGSVLKGIGRALDSGPLEAWYVDTVRALDADADITPGLGWRGAADGGALAVGAAVGGVLPGLVGGDASTALAAPFAVAAVLDLCYLLALLRLVADPVRPHPAGALRRLVADVRAVPSTVGEALRLSLRDRTLRVSLGLTALCGVVLSGLELLGPVRFAGITGSAGTAAGAFGAVMAVSYGAAALGSVAASRVRRLARGSTRATAAAVNLVGAAAVGVVAGPTVAVVAGAAFAVFYFTNGAVWPLVHAAAHSRVTAAHRASVLSAGSLALALGGITGSLLLPRLAERTSTATAFAAVAAALVVAAGLSLRLPSPGHDEEALLHEPVDDGKHLLGRLTGAEPGGGREHADEVAEGARAVAVGQQGGAVEVDAARPAQP